MAIVKAKDDIKVLMEDGRFSNFIKGHTYRCMFKGEDVYIIDEDKYGFQTDYNAAENKEYLIVGLVEIYSVHNLIGEEGEFLITKSKRLLKNFVV